MSGELSEQLRFYPHGQQWGRARLCKGQLVNTPLPTSLVSGGTVEAEPPQLSIREAELCVEGRYWASLLPWYQQGPAGSWAYMLNWRQWDCVSQCPTFTRRMSVRLRPGLTMYPTHLQQGNGCQNSTFSRVVSAKPSKKYNRHSQPALHATTKQGDCLLKKEIK